MRIVAVWKGRLDCVVTLGEGKQGISQSEKCITSASLCTGKAFLRRAYYSLRRRTSKSRKNLKEIVACVSMDKVNQEFSFLLPFAKGTEVPRIFGPIGLRPILCTRELFVEHKEK